MYIFSKKNTRIFLFISGIAFLLGCKQVKKTEFTSTTVPKTEIEKDTTITVIPIEHATAILQWNDYTIYIDPVGGKTAFEGMKKPDLILITDVHGDHFNLETLDSLDTEKAKLIVPQSVADKMPEAYTPQLDVLSNGESKSRFGITIEAVPMYNLREEALKFHPKGRGNGYVITLGNQRVYFSGDTEDIPEMRSLKHIDKAFVCMNLPYTMTEERAANGVLAFKPKEVYPYHYRGKPHVSKVQKFQKLIEVVDPSIKVVQLDWYPNDSF